jgi:GT2 family glycosyltransferase
MPWRGLSTHIRGLTSQPPPLKATLCISSASSTMATLAICIPSKNRQADVSRCLESIRKQDLAPCEIAIVDQSDVPYELPKIEGLIHLHRPNLTGTVEAMNLGARVCSAEVVLFLDDDVELLPDCLVRLMAAFQEPDVVAASCTVANEERELRWWTIYTRIFSRGFFNGAPHRPRCGVHILRRVTGCAYAIRRDVLLREPFDENLVGYCYGEDWELSYRLLRHGTLRLMPGARVIHHMSPRNRYSEAQMQSDRWENFLYFYDKLGASRNPMNRFWKIWWVLGESVLWLKAGMGLPFWRRSADVPRRSLSLRTQKNTMTSAHNQLVSSLLATARKARDEMGASIGQLYIDADHDYKNTVIITGNGRSGTTWIAELLNFDNSYRLIFEPLLASQVPLCTSFVDQQYLRPGDSDPAFLDPMKIIVSGRLRNRWSDHLNRQPFPRRRLIKEIRANLLLRWVQSHFPEIPLILLLRHPCAVSSSWRRMGWEYDLDVFLKQDSLMADFLSPFRAAMERVDSPLEASLYAWCIQTFVPLQQFKRDQIHLAFYENFCANPRLEVARLFAFLRRPVDERIFAVMDRPSSRTNRPKRKLPSRTDLVGGWRDSFSAQDLRRVGDVVRSFGLDPIYGEDGMPNVQAALELFAPKA